MTNFTYCYLSPFLVGLLTFAIWILAAVLICHIISKVYNWVIYDVSPVGRLRKTIDRIVALSGKWLAPILVGAFCIFVVVIVAFGAWNVGIEILKRFACK